MTLKQSEIVVNLVSPLCEAMRCRDYYTVAAHLSPKTAGMESTVILTEDILDDAVEQELAQ